LSYEFPTSTLPPSQSSWRTIRPIGAAALHGIAFLGNKLFAIDTVKGHLLQIDPTNDNTTILNPDQVEDFIDVTGLAVWEDTFWFTREDTVYFCDLSNLTPCLL
jgi:hypothetical protein